VQSSLGCQVEQSLVGHAAPQEVREPGSNLVLSDGLFVTFISRILQTFNAKQKVRGNQDRLNSNLNSLLERTPRFHACFDQIDNPSDFFPADGTTECLGSELADNLLCTVMD